MRLRFLKVDNRFMKYSARPILIVSLFFSFVTAALTAKNEGPLELSLPEGATITYQGSLGVSMYSIDSADIGYSMMITNMPSAPGIDSTSLLKVMSDTFVQQMKAQESIVGKLSPENPVPEDFKGETLFRSGNPVYFKIPKF